MYACRQSDFLQTLTTRKAIARNHAKTMPRYHHFFSDLQLWKALSPSDSTLFGITNSTSPDWSKAKSPMCFTDEGNLNDFNELHQRNAAASINLVLLLWKVTDCKLLQPENSVWELSGFLGVASQ